METDLLCPNTDLISNRDFGWGLFNKFHDVWQSFNFPPPPFLCLHFLFSIPLSLCFLVEKKKKKGVENPQPLTLAL